MNNVYKRENVWLNVDNVEEKEIFSYGERYKKFLDEAKTEREACEVIITAAEKKGFVNFEDAVKKGLKKGDKVYLNFRNKAAVLMVMGEDLEQGMNIVGSHIDVPRLDLKQVPLYENGNLALLKTHYYGGVKKYQWVCSPLALHGVFINNKGEKVNVVIGENDNDPVLFINDLLPHLGKDQMKLTMDEGIKGEQLNAVLGHSGFGSDKDSKNPVKDKILGLLNEKYGMTEEDFISAEFELVPAGKSRDVGLDRSMIAGHGHDDRVCSYANLEAILSVENPEITAVSLFVDKEEIGSVGNASMESLFFENMIAEIFAQSGINPFFKTRKSLERSKVLSADVTCGFDPSFPEVGDTLNTALIGNGVTISKYTGARGKGGCNDANAEFVGEIRNLFNENNVIWQTGELGKVDQGGGGTIAYILAKYGAEVVDCGTPMLSMHAPIELVSKADAYMTFKAYKSFLNR